MGISLCPICGRLPEVDATDDNPKSTPRGGWYALCADMGSVQEHCIGGSGTTKEQALQAWESDVKREKAKQAKSTESPSHG